MRSVTLPNVPGAHGVHEALPGTLEYVPGMHAEQVMPDSFLPAAHCAYDTAAVSKSTAVSPPVD